MTKRAIYIDTNSHGTMHDQFNAAMLLVCAKSFEEIYYYGGKSSMLNTIKLIDSSFRISIKQRKIAVVGGSGRFSLLLRTIVSNIQNIRFLIFSKQNQILIYNFNNFLSIRPLNFLNKIVSREIIICCHSELSFLANDCIHNNYIYNLRTRNLRDIFLNPNTIISDKLYFTVLGDSIKDNLSQIIQPNKLNHIISIDHPYFFSHIKIKNKSSKLKLGVIGTMAQEKGADILVEIAQKLKLKDRSDVSISIIGRILCKTEQFSQNGIILPSNLGKESIPRDEFDSLISGLDYILYLYPNSSYKFSASGSLLDSLNIESPVISFKNNYFQYIFNKFGDFGYLVDNVPEMISLIEELADPSHTPKIFEFEKIKSQFSPDAIKEVFISNLISIGFLDKKNDKH